MTTPKKFDSKKYNQKTRENARKVVSNSSVQLLALKFVSLDKLPK